MRKHNHLLQLEVFCVLYVLNQSQSVPPSLSPCLRLYLLLGHNFRVTLWVALAITVRSWEKIAGEMEQLLLDVEAVINV